MNIFGTIDLDIISKMSDKELHDLYMQMDKDDFKKFVKPLEEAHDKFVEKDGNGIENHKTILKSDKKLDRKELTIGYFGSQGRFYVPFLQDYIENVLKKPITYFAEAPAGSNSISYGMYKYGINTVATCDKNYWSNSVSKALIKS